MFRALSPNLLASTAVRHPWRVVAVWAVLLVAGMAAASTIGSVLTTEFKTLREDESVKANNLIDDRFDAEYGAEFVIVESESATVESAEFRAVAEQVVEYTPIVFSFALGLSFIILMVVFRSIVVPIKAIIMNMLSVGAAYGLIVLVFAEGVGANLLGFHQADRVDSWIPLFLFTVLFGLSMDYHVFLISRIRERYLETHDNRGAVIYGVRSTAGMITGAALIMVAVFGGFALGDLVAMQQMGFGLAVAVFIDATIVRSILVPASMELLGSANWYLPSWLQWLPRLDVEGVADRHHEAPAGAPAFGLD